MNNREQFKNNQERHILQASMYMKKEHIITVEESLDYYDYLKENLETKLTVIDKSDEVTINNEEYMIKKLKIKSKEDMVDWIRSKNIDEIFIYSIESSYLYTDIIYNLRYTYEDVKNAYPKMTLDNFNKLPYITDIKDRSLYNGYIKLEDYKEDIGMILPIFNCVQLEGVDLQLTIEKIKII